MAGNLNPPLSKENFWEASLEYKVALGIWGPLDLSFGESQGGPNWFNSGKIDQGGLLGGSVKCLPQIMIPGSWDAPWGACFSLSLPLPLLVCSVK